MKESLSTLTVNGKIYLLDRVSELEASDPYVYKVGGYLSSKEINPMFNPDGIYYGLVIVPDTEFNNNLPENIKNYMIYHECGHCQPGGIPTKAEGGMKEYYKHSLRYETLADAYACTCLGKEYCIEALKEFHDLEVENIKKVHEENNVNKVLRKLTVWLFNIEINYRIKHMQRLAL
jgi:hypothetical protein